MTSNDFGDAFIEAAQPWLYDGYSLDVRYIARATLGRRRIWSAAVLLNPLPAKYDFNLDLKTAGFEISQIQRASCTRTELLAAIKSAIDGLVLARDGTGIRLDGDSDYSLSRDTMTPEVWFSDLHLQVVGAALSAPSAAEAAAADDGLRCSPVPFDGLADAANWLGLDDPRKASNPATISVRVGPPIDMDFDECKLSDGSLHVSFKAHVSLDVSQVGIAVRAMPGAPLASRQQVGQKIEWTNDAGFLRGRATLLFDEADGVLVMLSIGGTTVRRQWFVDPNRSRNKRYIATQHFDSHLQKLRDALLVSTDSRLFEVAVESLLFLLGFSAGVQIEKDAPDIVAMTPTGRLVLIECTLRVGDIAKKVGKLIDRRTALAKGLAASRHVSDVTAVLVCRLPRDQIAASLFEMSTNGVVLLTHEDLAAGLDRALHPLDPDELLRNALAKMQPSAQMPN